MHIRGRTLALLLVTPALALGACGGGGGDEGDIKDVVQDVAKDSSTICEHASKKLLEQLGGQDGCDKLARAYPDDKPKEIEGDIDVKVDGDTARAKFTDNDGKKQDVEFVKEDGEWKVNSTGT